MPAIATVRIDDRIAKRHSHEDTRQKLRVRDGDAKDGPPGGPFQAFPGGAPGAPGHDGKDGKIPGQTASSQTGIAHATATVSVSPQQTTSLVTSSTSVSSAQQISASVSSLNTPANVELISIRPQPARLSPHRRLRLSSQQVTLIKQPFLHQSRLQFKHILNPFWLLSKWLPAYPLPKIVHQRWWLPTIQPIFQKEPLWH